MNRYRFVAGALIGVVGLAVGYWLATYVHPFGLQPWMVRQQSLHVFVFSVRDLVTRTILTPAFFIVIAVTLTLERLFPAEPNQAIFSVNVAQDLVWFFYETILQAIVIATYVQLLTIVYQQYFRFLTINPAGHWPSWVRFAVSLLLLDFLYWGQHYTNHKVPLFWSFHTVHHSQKRLNFFTDFRYHVLEYIVRHTWLVIPFLVLRVDPPQIVWFAIVARWYTRFYHGNIRTNLGPLRYVLVTPQSHRIHHSIEPRHRDTNFGALFSVWDQLLGTQYRGYDEYPETGIEDEGFPHERIVDVKSLMLRPLIQMAYPLRQIRKERAAFRSSRNRAADRPAA
jgi:sterol desaturase/sphingolipid hydroxylase (fatty acid hydroxylase superfamily)